MEEHSENTHCKNCNALINGNYCYQCGQKTSVHKITFRETFQDFVDNVFSINAPLIHTVKYLIINPGKVFRGFLGGKRKTYYKPVPFFILTTVLYVIIRSIIQFDPFQEGITQGDVSPKMQIFIDAGKFMFKNIDNFLFFFVGTLGLVLKLFFYRIYTLAEYIAISFYCLGIYTLVTCFNLSFMKYVNPNVQYLGLLIILIYLVYAMTSLFMKNKIVVGVKTVFSLVLSFFFYIVLAFSLSLFIVWYTA